MINTEKAVKVAGDFRTIYLSIALLLSGVAWAADSYFDGKYMKVVDGAKISKQIKFDNLEEAIEETAIQIQFSNNQAEKDRLKAILEYKKTKMDNLIKKYSLEAFK